MKNHFMTLAYDGTRFFGWQRQKGHPTIQETLEEVLLRITGERIRVHGSGRTDAGVHALRQGVSFMSSTRLEPATLHRALGALLPSALHVWGVRQVPAEFHARRSATGKRYAYRIVREGRGSPFGRDYYTEIRYPLSVERMREAAARMVGRRDFAAFGTNPGRDRGSTVRSVRKLRLHQRGALLSIMVEGDGFLYNMVRTIAGTLVDVGRGRFSPEDVSAILDSRDRRRAGPVLPPGGLFLVRALYPEFEAWHSRGGASGSSGASDRAIPGTPEKEAAT